MGYRYETHLHTKEGSACAGATAKEMVHAYKNAGYAGIIVTDHFFYGNTAVPRELPWEEWVQEFCKGYEHAKEEGDRIGLQVFFGWESGYQGTEFLIYGLDKQWLLEHPEIRDASVEEQWTLVEASGGLVIHAHPFREEPYIPEIRLYPQHVHGVEAINTTHSSPKSCHHCNPAYNEQALCYAREHNLPITGGSDAHDVIMLDGGIEVETPLQEIGDYVSLMKENRSKVILGRDRY